MIFNELPYYFSTKFDEEPSKHLLFVDESAFSSRLAVFSRFGVPLLEPSVMKSAVFPSELPSSSLWGLLLQFTWQALNL